MAVEDVSLRQSATWGAVAFGVTFAVIIGARLDKAALAAVVGVFCGVAASIPSSFLMMAVLRRRDERSEKRGTSGGQNRAMQPPVVVVTSPALPQFPPQTAWSGGYGTAQLSQREFAVIGEEEIEDF